MTPITERLAEAREQIIDGSAREAERWVAAVAVNGSLSGEAAHRVRVVIREAVEAALALRTHPAEGGEGRVVGYYVSTRNECDEEMGYLYLSSTEAQRHADEPSSYHWTVEPVYTAPPPQPVAPERGEAKAVAHVVNRAMCEPAVHTYDSIYELGLGEHKLYATPQPPPAPICGRCGKPRSELCGDDFIPATTPAPGFRDPTIEDAVRMLDAQNHFNGSSVKRTLAALNAIGAKVEEKT